MVEEGDRGLASEGVFDVYFHKFSFQMVLFLTENIAHCHAIFNKRKLVCLIAMSRGKRKSGQAWQFDSRHYGTNNVEHGKNEIWSG